MAGAPTAIMIEVDAEMSPLPLDLSLVTFIEWYLHDDGMETMLHRIE